jgi:hypothetical protein
MYQGFLHPICTPNEEMTSIKGWKTQAKSLKEMVPPDTVVFSTKASDIDRHPDLSVP